LAVRKQAGILVSEGKYGQAQPLLAKLLEVRSRLLTDDQPDTAESYNNLAANLTAQGKFAATQPLYEKALAICLGLLTYHHPDTAVRYTSPATNLFALTDLVFCRSP
jgi:tetratricopeptide (TPR) repeat protein